MILTELWWILARWPESERVMARQDIANHKARTLGLPAPALLSEDRGENDAETAVRAVQGWMALDLHMALDRPVDHASEHQGHRSWADWWAELCGDVRESARSKNEPFAAAREAIRQARGDEAAPQVPVTFGPCGAADLWDCPTCGPVTLEPHPRLPVMRCSNCKEHAGPRDYEATTGHAITCGAGFGADCDCDEQRRRAHSEGEHAFCGDECDAGVNGPCDCGGLPYVHYDHDAEQGHYGDNGSGISGMHTGRVEDCPGPGCGPGPYAACAATATTADMTFGPCVKRERHKDWHEDVDGSQWTERCRGCGHTEREGCGCPPEAETGPPYTSTASHAFHALRVRALHDADHHSCQEQDGVDYVALADAVARVRDKNMRVMREWIAELSGAPAGTVGVPGEALRGLVRVAQYVADNDLYPDPVHARRALGALDDAGLLDQLREEDQ